MVGDQATCEMPSVGGGLTSYSLSGILLDMVFVVEEAPKKLIVDYDAIFISSSEFMSIR